MIENFSKKISISPELIVCFILCIMTFFAYMPVINHDFINLDDPFYVYANKYVNKGFTTEGFKWAFFSFHVSNWHPITWLSHMLDCQLYGLDPNMHHITNLVLHILNTILLFFIFFRATNYIWKSAFIAAFFALHPMHVESVAWISERKDVLSTFFMLLTFLFYIEYIRSQNKPKYWAAVFCFALGLMSKPMIVTLPFLLLVFDFWPLGRVNFSWTNMNIICLAKLFFEKIPFFLLTFFSCLITIIAQKGAIGSIASYPLSHRLCNSIISYLEYIRKLLNPVNLAIFYPYPEKNEWTLFFISLSVLLTISLTAVFNAKKHPYFLSGWLWYIGTLVPVIGLVQVGNQSMADRYTYIPYIGLFVIIVFGLYRFSEQAINNKRIVHIVFIFILVFFIFVTRFQVRLWDNSVSILGHTIKVTNDNFEANINLGGALMDKKKYPEAIRCFSEAIRIKPESRVAHSDIGVAFMMMNQYDKAIQSFMKAIELKADLESAYYNIGYIYFRQGRFTDSIKYFHKTTQLNPENVNAYINIGAVYAILGDFDQAILCYQKAHQLGHSAAKKSIDKLLQLKMEK